jgi:aspartyl-tRNA(Asn)/glutamyl-tRNA(Gln) amidotransferase subunit A
MCAETAPELTDVPDGIFLARPEPLPGPAEGISLAVKDLFDTAGLTTTYGSPIFADHVPDCTAEAVTRLEAGGYVDVGKTNLHEFAYGVTSQNLHFGTVPNPIAPGRIAGGSSGGSAAALAAGLADAALGTDSGGSIRIPAACCSVVGLKPTFGLVPVDGVFPLAPTFDHVGPMACTVDDCIRMMETLVPGFQVPDRGDLTIGVAWSEHCDPLVQARVEETAALLGAGPVEFPLPDGIDHMFMSEVADVHRDLFAEHADSYGENVRTKIESCLEVTEAQHAAAAQRRTEYRELAEQALVDNDLLLVPTLAIVAPPNDIDERSMRAELIRFTFPFNALGWPALAMPAGTAEEGLPASVQLVGRAGDDGLVLAAGQALATRAASS